MVHVAQIAVEVSPFAKVGGLGDVIHGLGLKLQELGHQVSTIIPFYSHIDRRELNDLHPIDEVESFYNGQMHKNRIWTAHSHKLKLFLIEPLHTHRFFERGAIYGSHDDTDRFLYFSRAALTLLHKWEKKGNQANVIHYHDWHSAAVGPLYRSLFQPQETRPSRLIFTIHNFAYQGCCGIDCLERVGLPPEFYQNSKDMWGDDYNCINLLKSGIVYADKVTTVSPNHAEEVLTREGGHGLHKTLLRFKNKFSGILNGIDYEYWNPETDPFLKEGFKKGITETPHSKLHYKEMLQKRFGLEVGDIPLVACVTRLVPQKGIELIQHAIHYTLQKQGQFILSGSCAPGEIQKQFESLGHLYRNSRSVHLKLAYNEELTHQIFAASDFFVVPSLFEPCGLTPLIALRYGSIPIVRQTGGLSDSIKDVEQSPEGNGFVFRNYNTKDLEKVFDRALSKWTRDKDLWNQFVDHGMDIDNSWSKPALSYLKLYKG